MAVDAGNITGIVALVGVAIAFYRLWRIETPHGDADLVGKYRKLATEATDSERAMKTRVDELERKVDGLEAAWAEAETYIAKLDGYVDSLVTVMKSHGLMPAEPRPRRKAKKEEVM